MQELELTKDTVDRLATNVFEAEKALAVSQEHVQYLENRHAEQSNQVIAKDVKAADECETILRSEREAASFSADLQQARAQNATDKYLLRGVQTALASRKKASQRRISNHVKIRENVLADFAFIDTEFQTYRADIYTKLCWLPARLGETKVVQTSSRKNVSDWFSPRSLLRRGCDIDLMIGRTSRTYSTNWMVLSIRSVALRKL